VSTTQSTVTNTTYHPEHLAYRAAMLLMRTVIALQPKADLGPAGRAAFDASPLYGDMAGLPPVLLHAGEDEILLDDARRYADRSPKSGSEANCVSERAWRTSSRPMAPSCGPHARPSISPANSCGAISYREQRFANFRSTHSNGETHMTNILFVGQKPETVDFSDPSLPPGFNAEKINAGIALGVKKIEEHGWKGDTCMITPDAAGSAMLEKALAGANYACVVIGGGMRLPPKGLVLFETVVNIIHKAAPNATIAFNTRPEDTADAAARQLKAA
jgi:hypothetical protein